MWFSTSTAVVPDSILTNKGVWQTEEDVETLKAPTGDSRGLRRSKFFEKQPDKFEIPKNKKAKEHLFNKNYKWNKTITKLLKSLHKALVLPEDKTAWNWKLLAARIKTLAIGSQGMWSCPSCRSQRKNCTQYSTMRGCVSLFFMRLRHYKVNTAK